MGQAIFQCSGLPGCRRAFPFQTMWGPKNMRAILSSLALALSIALLGSSPALAQVGSIAGTVKDASSAVLPGATVKLSPRGASAASDSQGLFTIPGVAPGA